MLFSSSNQNSCVTHNYTS